MTAHLRTWRRFSTVLTGIVLAAGCGNDSADLHAWVDAAGARPGGGIEPLPAVRPVPAFVYEPAGRRSPFMPDTALATPGASPTPDRETGPSRRREYLEQFPLDSLRMVGTLETRGTVFGLVRTADGLIHRVAAGQHLGPDDGRIVSITQSAIALVETAPDGQGGQLERAAELGLAD